MFNYRRQILTPLIIAAALLCVAMVWLFFVMYKLVYFSEQKDALDRQRYDIVVLGKAITDAESGQRGYLLTGHTMFLDTFEQGRAETEQVIARLEKRTSTRSVIAPELQRLRQMVAEKIQATDQSIQLQLDAGAHASQQALRKDKSRALMQHINAHLTMMDGKLDQLRNHYEQEIRRRMIESVLGAVLLGMLIIGVLLFSYYSTTHLLERMLENQAVARQMSHHADHDLLTGLPNRRSVDARLAAALQRAKHGSTAFAIFFMDLDGFKQVNDRYGHGVGDTLLIEVATRLGSVLRQSDFLARQGGDEFLLVVEHYLHHRELVLLAERLISLFAQPVTVNGLPLEIGISIGVAEYPQHGKQVKALMQVADKAMYAAKKTGRNRYRFGSDA